MIDINNILKYLKENGIDIQKYLKENGYIIDKIKNINIKKKSKRNERIEDIINLLDNNNVEYYTSYQLSEKYNLNPSTCKADMKDISKKYPQKYSYEYIPMLIKCKNKEQIQEVAIICKKIFDKKRYWDNFKNKI